MTTIDQNSSIHMVAYAGFLRRPDRELLSPAAVARSAKPTELERLVQLTNSNDRLIEQLALARRRLVQALEYADDPRSRPNLGEALVGLARKRHARVLESLRANRSSALAILAGLAEVR